MFFKCSVGVFFSLRDCDRVWLLNYKRFVQSAACSWQTSETSITIKKSKATLYHVNISRQHFFVYQIKIWRARDGAVVRALTSHQCELGSNPGVDAICGLIKFVVGSLLCSEKFFSGYSSGFPLSSKTNISKFQFDQESGRWRTTLWMCNLPNHYLLNISLKSCFTFCMN